MAAVLGEPAVAAPAWADRRQRAVALRERHQFAAEVLTLYLSLLDAQEPAFEAARAHPPAPEGLAGYVAEVVLPRIIEATVAAGPDQLVRSVTARFHTADLEAMVAAWLADEDQPPVDRFLARASCGPVLEAVPGLLPQTAPAGHERRCPSCGGAPGLACFGVSTEALVTAPRRLLCSRCGGGWSYPRMTCAACGETDTSRLAIYSDPDRFPHLRIDGCLSCRRYLVTVDMPKDPLAVPVVDEITAIPLDLYAKDRGMTKVVPNLMGI